MFKKEKCSRCKGRIKENYSFCPVCGLDLRNPKKDERDFGMLGRNNLEGYPAVGGGSFGFSDKIIEKILNSFMKNMPDMMKGFEKQFDEMNPEVEQLPNGIRIQFGAPSKQGKKQAKKKGITQEQLNKMAGKPRVEAKSNVRRLADRVLYELNAVGIDNVEDVFISKLEKGYEVKAIGKNKVYVNTLPVNLPLKGYRIDDKNLIVEFGTQ